MRVRTKILGVSLGGIAVAICTMVGIVLLKGKQVQHDTLSEVQKRVQMECASIVSGVHLMLRTQH